MRDGVMLSADIYRPTESEAHPVVLCRTCYTKVGPHPHKERARFWTRNGYAYVVQDVRGRGDSEGEFYPLLNEREDGFDTIEWIVSQDWCDGHALMIGSSYSGWTQLFAACSNHPNLAAVVPTTAPADPDRGFPTNQGTIMPAAGIWMATLDGHINQDLAGDNLDEAMEQRSLIDFDRKLGRNLKQWRDWVINLGNADYWSKLSYQKNLIHTSVPMLHISGWYDDCLNGALENFSALLNRDGEQLPTQRLIIGPWLHSSIGDSSIGAADFGQEARVDIDELQRKWFDDCLTDKAAKEPPVRLFVMGRNQWIEATEWPVPGTQYIDYFLRSSGRANGRLGDGRLSLAAPAQLEPPDKFSYNPIDPVPYAPSLDWKQVGGPDDFAEIEMREDILVYTGPVVEIPLLICGPISVELYASTSALDTDWTAKVLDVYPDGKAIRLNDGAVRIRFANSDGIVDGKIPNMIHKYEIDCWATCVELMPGHRIRLEISSSAYGKYDVNTNTDETIGFAKSYLVAEQTVFHDLEHPSRLIIPVLPNY